MFTDFIITFRETLEAALVVGIVLSYLAQTGSRSWFGTVYWAIGLAIITSIGAGYLFEIYLGGFEGAAEEIYEGIIMLTAAALISWMVVWMVRQKQHLSRHLKEQVDKHIQTEHKVGVFLLVFLSVLREGIETVLFLKAAAIQAGGNNLLAAILGILLAVGLGIVIFTGLKKISMQRFFQVSTIILVLFAAGLVAHGVHELEEAGWIPVLVEHVWDVNPPVLEEGVYPLLHEDGAIGGLFKGVFGWNGNPSFGEVLSYVVYLLGMVTMMRIMNRPQPSGRG
jgi:high-affinity iron transporter